MSLSGEISLRCPSVYLLTLWWYRNNVFWCNICVWSWMSFYHTHQPMSTEVHSVTATAVSDLFCFRNNNQTFLIPTHYAWWMIAPRIHYPRLTHCGVNRSEWHIASFLLCNLTRLISSPIHQDQLGMPFIQRKAAHCRCNECHAVNTKFFIHCGHYYDNPVCLINECTVRIIYTYIDMLDMQHLGHYMSFILNHKFSLWINSGFVQKWFYERRWAHTLKSLVISVALTLFYS